MNRVIVVLLVWTFSAASLAATGHGPALLEANVNLSNKTSLQRGARMFVNYCLSCHSAKYMRYGRMADDLEIDHDVVSENLMFASDKIGDTMTIAMRPQDAEKWFGVAPPDLSVIARARGEDWLYSFLNGFYLDAKRPTGVNNLYFPDTAMPHVLSELQGMQRRVDEAPTEPGAAGHGGVELTAASAGRLSAEEYAQATRDLVAFLVYIGEPAKLVRYRVGFWVIAFLLVLLASAYLLKREYWKDVH